jgi:PEP-CTERM motif
MLTKRFLPPLAASVLLLAPLHARAGYVSQAVPLNSDVAGPGAGMVVAEAYAGTGGPINGLLPGQVRLTFTVSPSAAYGEIGPHFGLANVVFNTDLSINASQIAGPAAWPVNPFETTWRVWAPAPDVRARAIAVVISGLGDQATLDHFLKLYQGHIGAAGPLPRPFVFSGLVDGFELHDPDNPFNVDGLLGDTVLTTPEPTSLALCGIGLVGLGVCYRRRRAGQVKGDLIMPPQVSSGPNLG